MISSIISRLVILVFGTLYPAYASYKAVRTKNVKEYVKWMMYWIVFALFTCAETFTDVFCSFWFPFYYEFKVILVLWLLSPATKGSSILYRKFVHPMLTKREQEIDEYIAKAKEQGYHTVLTLGTKGVNYATTVIMQTAIKSGGGIVNQLRRSYSLSDISADMDAIAEINRSKGHPEDELDIGDTPLPIDPRLRRSRGYSPRRSASGSGRVEMYFPEVDVNVRQRGTRPRETGIPLSHIRSTEDVSSGYSSAELLYSGQPVPTDAQEPLVRTSSVGSSRVTRTKTARGGAAAKRPAPPAEDYESWTDSEESGCGNQEEYFYEVSSEVPYEPVAILPSSTIQPASPQPAIHDLKKSLIVAAVPNSSDKHEAELDSSPDKILIVLRNERLAIQLQSSEISKCEPWHQEMELDVRENATTVQEPLSIEEKNLKEVMPINIVKLISPNNILSIAVNDSQFCENKALSPIEETHSDITKDDDFLIASNMAISKVSDEKLENVREVSSKKIKEDVEDAEYFDSENVVKENDSTSLLRNDAPDLTSSCPDVNIDQAPHRDIQLINQFDQKPLDEFGKDSRAGRYHKLPAPCPPQRLNVELSKAGPDKEKSEVLPSSCKSSLPRNPSPVLKCAEASPNISKKEIKVEESEGISPQPVEREMSLVQSHEHKGVSNSSSSTLFGGKPDFKASGCTKFEPPPSPNQTRTDLKSKHDAPFISRLLSKPKSQLTSIFPFFSTRDDMPNFTELMSSSLTSLDDNSSAQGLMRNSSTASDYVSKAPELPPRKRTPETDNVTKETAEKDLLTKAHSHESRSKTPRESGAWIQIREMSHSPPRYLSKQE